MAKYTLKSCGVNTARFLKYVWPFYNMMHERVKISIMHWICQHLACHRRNTLFSESKSITWWRQICKAILILKSPRNLSNRQIQVLVLRCPCLLFIVSSVLEKWLSIFVSKTAFCNVKVLKLQAEAANVFYKKSCS